MRDEIHSNHLFGNLFYFSGDLPFDAALPFASPARVNLRFDDNDVRSYPSRCLPGFVGAGDNAARHGNAFSKFFPDIREFS